MSRQFIAVVPAGLKDNQPLRQLLGKLKRTMSDRKQEARWTPADLWHVTVQFLGEVPAAREEELKAAFLSWSPHLESVTLRLQGLGAFPEATEARTLWVGVQENQEFQSLQADLKVHLSQAGFFTEERDFRPHLTLARFRNALSASELIQLGGRKHFGDYPVHELILFSSVLQGNIIKYVPLARKSVTQ